MGQETHSGNLTVVVSRFMLSVVKDTFRLDELATAAGVSPRTVRYYVQRGLLPAPHFRGKDTSYDRDHLLRLRVIRRLQEAYLPLEAIAVELATRTPAELSAIASGAAPKPAPTPAVRTAAPPVTAGETWTRFSPHPGLELALSHHASRETRELFEALLRLIDERNGRP
jgi:DNA-binding transcriptional MerR regulator